MIVGYAVVQYSCRGMIQTNSYARIIGDEIISNSKREIRRIFPNLSKCRKGPCGYRQAYSIGIIANQIPLYCYRAWIIRCDGY